MSAMSKYSKRRACPAAGRDISTAECGEKRGSQYACPVDCAYSPLAPANYLQLLEIEDSLDHKCMDYLLEHASDRAGMERALQKARHESNPHALHAFYEWNLFFAPDSHGLTCAQRWEKSGFPGLKNDERVLLRAKMQTRLALLEIHRVLDHERIEAVDLLAPDAQLVRLQDRNLARVATRFATAVAWVYPLPHYWRLSGTGVLVPDFGPFAPRDIVVETVRHLGGPADEAGLRRWLAENLVRFDESLRATGRMRRAQMFAALDAKYGKAVYELRAPFAECRERLDGQTSVEPEELSPTERAEGFAETRVWFEDASPSPQAVPPGGRPVLGRVLLGQAHWRLETMGEEKFQRLRQKFEDIMGERVRLTGERLDDLAATLAAKEPVGDTSLVPPRLLEHPQKIIMATSRVPLPAAGKSKVDMETDVLRAADRAFLDDPIPALNGHTPREAARDPALRPELIRLLKQRVRACDERNLQTGGTDDINWLLRELGAEEILFDPPPWRPPLEPPGKASSTPEDDDYGVDDYADEPPEPDWSLPLAPPLPDEPLDVEEAARRLDAVREAFDSPEDTFDALADAGITVVDDALELTGDMLGERDAAFAMVFMAQVAFALVPPGHRAPPTSFDSLRQTLAANMKGMEQSLRAGKPDVMMKFLEKCPQSAVAGLVCGQMMELAVSGPKELRPSLDAQPVIIALIKSVTEELDRVLRP